MNLIALLTVLTCASPTPPEGMVYVHPGSYMMGE
jgi:hypothetical protein